MADSGSHPTSLRPGGPSPSTTPQPEQQEHQNQNMSSSAAAAAAAAAQYGAPSSQPTGPQQSTQPVNFSSRFPSTQYPPNLNINYSQDAPSGTAGGNQFTEHGPRSRSSTVGQNYPIPAELSGSQQQPAMPSPPHTQAQPLFAQHSGQAGPSSSRPASRSHPQALPMNPSVLHPSHPVSVNPSRPTTSGGGPAKSPFTPPITSPPRSRPSQILLINPTSTYALTTTMLTTLRPILPPQLEVIGYTAPYPAPTATESTVDAALSTELILRDLAKYSAANGETVQNFDAMLIASYSKHPLIDALRESYDVPIIGIMEGSLYVSRMLGARFGIIATTTRHKIQQDDAVAAYGLSHFFVGSESLHLSPLELDATGSSGSARSKDEVAKRMALAARALVARGADTIILGSEAMSCHEAIRAAKDAIREEDGRRTVNVVDSVEAGVMCLNALVGMGVPTSKKGVFKGERDGRRARGQNWL